MKNFGLREIYQGWEPILAQTMLPKASSPTTDSIFPFTLNFFFGDSFKGFSSLLRSTAVTGASFWGEATLNGGAGTVFEDAGLLDGENFAVLIDKA